MGSDPIFSVQSLTILHQQQAEMQCGLARIASQLAVGAKLSDFELKKWDQSPYIAVKEAVLPFNKFPEESIFLSPEMKSTGEVMGISKTLGESFRKASISAGTLIPGY